MGDGWAGYGISKAALNAATRKFASALQPRGISVNAASPGWVKTDMGTDSAPLSVDQGAKNIIRLIDMPHSVTNSYLEANGEIQW
jgi:NAD(P)-dependent dehydrogenase (short-subunit alcohol dehydrogenase family)